MKIINANTARLQTIPFSLGEAGRGRWLEDVKVSNRPGQEPSGPEDVGYSVFGEEHKHVILTKGNPNQRGVLVRINTSGVYTKNSCGSIKIIGGDAELLTEGSWAEGLAGHVASGPDQLWHVKGPALFAVVLQGGEHKGMGHRYLIVTEKYRTLMIKRADLCQLIVVDRDPELVATVRMFADQLHADVQSALKTADELETAMDHEAPAAVVHFHPEYGTLEETVEGYGLALPPIMGGKVTGVSGVQANTLMPGHQSLVALTIGPGGGRLYRHNMVEEKGLVRIAQGSDQRNRETILAIVQDPEWFVAWTNHRVAETTAYVVADANGVHTFHPENFPVDGKRYRTEPWFGIKSGPVDTERLCRIHGLHPQALKVGGDRNRWGDDRVVASTEPVRAPEPTPMAAPAEPPKALSAAEVRAQLATAGIRIGRR